MLSAGTVLLHATRASHRWLMGKYYSYISTSISYRTVQGSWLLVSLCNNGECQREGWDVKADQSERDWRASDWTDGWMNWWKDSYPGLKDQVNLSLFLSLRHFSTCFLDLKVSQGQLIVRLLLFHAYYCLSLFSFSFLLCLLYLFSFSIFTRHLIPHSLST